MAPLTLFFVHFNNLLRSPAERLAKVRRYAQHDKETAWRVIDEYLPELTDKVLHDFSSDGLEEFEPLVSLLQISCDSHIPELTQEEAEFMRFVIQRWLAESARTAQQTALHYERFAVSKLSPLPASVLKSLAELCMTLGRAMKRQALYDFGLHVWDLKKLKDELSGLRTNRLS